MITAKTDDEVRLNRLAISPGLASGLAYVHRDILDQLQFQYSVSDDKIDDEWCRIKSALDVVDDDLRRSAARVDQELGHEMAVEKTLIN